MKHLILLHGALGDSAQFDVLSTLLADDFDVHSFDFSGHGANDYNGEITMIRLSQDISDYIDLNDLDACYIFGYSMGGYAAMKLATNSNSKISSLMTLATKWNWDEYIASREIKMLDPVVIVEKVPAFAEVLRQRHSGIGWEKLLNKTSDMMRSQGQSGGFSRMDLAKVNIPICICLGSEDKMVTVEESEMTARSLLHAQFKLLPNMPHAFDKIDMAYLADEIKIWFLKSF